MIQLKQVHGSPISKDIVMCIKTQAITFWEWQRSSEVNNMPIGLATNEWFCQLDWLRTWKHLCNLWWIPNQAIKVPALPQEGAHPDNFNDILQPICDFQGIFPLLWVRIKLDHPEAPFKGKNFKLTYRLRGVVGMVLAHCPQGIAKNFAEWVWHSS